MGHRGIFSVLSCVLLCYWSESFAARECKKVRFSDVGWSDITATTALASVILESLGYETKTVQLSVPVTFVSLKNQDIDVFMGNWMPSMAADIKPYQAEGSVDTVGTVLKNARYTLAVPQYVYEAGVRSVADVAAHADKFQKKVFGIEPGNDGNRLISKMISENAFGLGSWKLMESSEQAMLMEVNQAVRRKKWVLFLGWEPHPMNRRFAMNYLTGADSYFGANQGSSTVYVNTRKNYTHDCPEVGQFLKKFSLSVENENALMDLILSQGMEPKMAAKQWIKTNWTLVEPWLNGMKSRSGEPALSALKKGV